MTKINSRPLKSSTPKYREIGEKLIHQILSNKYATDSLLPTEKRLCEDYAISRHTAREALRYLEKSGLVERRQGSGTIVKRNVMPEQINEFINSVNDLLLFGQRTRFEIKVSDTLALNSEMADLLDTKEGESCIHVGGVRIEPHDKKPICYSNIYRIPHMDAVDEQLKSTDTAIYAVIKALDPRNIGKIEQQISACLVPAEMAEQLDAELNSAAMKITRRYFDKSIEDLIFVAESIYPAKRFRSSSVLYPNE
jgi:DNA-binding GntR family transcriptional regulator